MTAREQTAVAGGAAGCLCILAFLFGVVTERVRARCDTVPTIQRQADVVPPARITSSLTSEEHP